MAPHFSPSAILSISVNPNIHIVQNGTNQQEKRGMAECTSSSPAFALGLVLAVNVPLTNEHSKLNA